MSTDIQKKAIEWQRKDRDESIGKIKVGCVVGMVLVPSFAMLDFVVYPGHAMEFLGVRLACSLIIGLFLAVLLTPFGLRHYRALGVSLVLLPGAAISYMIYATAGANSPYYAGLNLVLLVVGFVLRWTYRESLIAVLLVFTQYVVACWLNGSMHPEQISAENIVNNFYFLAATGVIVVTGNYYFSRARYRQFELAYDLAEQKKLVEENNLQLERSRLELEKTNQRLLELDQAKSRFFANISHELRTPLTLLIAPLETLVRKFSRSVDPEIHETLSTMHANAMRLLKLINDLLELVRLESGRVETRQDVVDVESFISGISSAARQVARDKQLHLETHAEPGLGRVILDRDKLEKVLLNLLFNALKFTPAGGSVRLEAARCRDAVVFSVSDTGIGIAPENLRRIFDRFWQADGSSKRKYQGAGIGLSLVKELTEAQGGSVEVESQPGKGARFTVSLPYVPAPEQESPGAAEADLPAPMAAGPEEWLANLYRRAELFPALAPVHDSIVPVEVRGNGKLPTVLVADDEPDMLRFLKNQLRSVYNVIEAVDGQQAFEKASQFLPDLIVLDMMMPGKDGLQACAEIRGQTSTRNIPVILLTARADDATKMSALAAGASDFLAKPFSTAELQARIKNLVDNHAYQRQLSKQNRVLEATNDRLKNTIDQLKETELQLVQSEKLASLGRMSAGIIHEINNPLNYVNTGLMVLKKKAPLLAGTDRADYLEVLKDVEDGVMRMRNIVSDLRTFSVDNGHKREPVRLAEAVQFAVRFLGHELKNGIHLEQHVPEALAAMGNTNLLVQVLVNLVKNSIDALSAKTFVNGDKPSIWIDGGRHGEVAILKVRDNGTGIAEEHIDKIFDPFFSTKDQGQGMGLGLSLCYKIVQSLGGKISVDTQPGRHCEFRIELPIDGKGVEHHEPDLRLQAV